MFSINKECRIEQVIPDNSKKGLVCDINIVKDGKIEDFNLGVDIEHGFMGDLTIQLITPSGKKVMLHDRAGGNTKNMRKTYDREKLGSLIGEACTGTWKLQIKDHAPRDSGSLKSWSLQMRCSEKNRSTEIIIPDDAKKSLESVQQCHVSGKVSDLQVMVDISHNFIGDMTVDLVAPSGNVVNLHNRGGGNTKNLKKTYSGDAVKEMIGESTEGNWTLRMRDYAPKDQGMLRRWKVTFKCQQVDDLKKVEGIGPKIESLLNNAGIYSWNRLSATSPSIIKEVLTAAGDRFKMHDPRSWPDQAKMADAGEWAKLEKWQDEHDGGRLN